MFFWGAESKNDPYSTLPVHRHAGRLWMVWNWYIHYDFPSAWGCLTALTMYAKWTPKCMQNTRPAQHKQTSRSNTSQNTSHYFTSPEPNRLIFFSLDIYEERRKTICRLFVYTGYRDGLKSSLKFTLKPDFITNLMKIACKNCVWIKCSAQVSN